MNFKIEPVTPFQRVYDKNRKLKTDLLKFANGKDRPAPLPVLGVIKGKVKVKAAGAGTPTARK